MDEQCFYCNNQIEHDYYHGLFVQQNEHVEKPLCKDCYKDWLEGIKG
jgi:NAD-dependent SIR2 family protein deacetylase